MKRAKFGTKFFELATSDYIHHDFIIYQGIMEPLLIKHEGEDWMETERIPFTLVDPNLNKGHTLTIDSMYTTALRASCLFAHQVNQGSEYNQMKQKEVDQLLEQKFQRFSITEIFFLLVTSFCCLLVSFFMSKGKCLTVDFI